MTDDKPLPQPLTLTFNGADYPVSTVREAYAVLTEHWPEEARGPRYEDATGACLKVLDGHRSTVDALDTIRAAAEEAGIAVNR